MERDTPFRRKTAARKHVWPQHIRKPEPAPKSPSALPVLVLAAILGAVSGLYLWGPAGTSAGAVPQPEGIAAGPENPAVPRRQARDAPTVRFSRCSFGSRANCVVDGDTVWLGGEKIRLSDINTPEIGDPDCAYEKQLGERATERLIALLNSGRVQVIDPSDSPDRDRYDRLLRELHVSGASVGDTLVREGLAEEWQGFRRDWC
uniref:thermonuclease family protein n=1 Tax=Parerythrobacter lutipelagi TaxID=1964208 RepID=UPI0010F9B439|nr:thermonuclease family protein [Parerythrobacter lutipelagi]